MSNFEKIYKQAARGAESKSKGSVSPRLEPLLKDSYDNLIRTPADFVAIKDSLVTLFSFLTSPEGRTDANCWATDLFFSIDDDWEKPWADLPDAFVDVLRDAGGCLHDTIRYPEIARNFDSTPEQLLQRTKGLNVEQKCGDSP